MNNNFPVTRTVALMLVFPAALFLGACAGGSVTRMSVARSEAIRHNQLGVQEEIRGNATAALSEFSEALRLHSAIENADGMIVALVNIARLNRLKGNLPAAMEVVDRAVHLLQSHSELASEAYFEKGKILLAAGDLPAAKDWSLRALAAEKGTASGRRINLVAQILARQGLFEEAREHAERALAANRSEGMVEEEANSLRLLGEIHCARGRYDASLSSFNEALTRDKELGLAKKVAADLRGMGDLQLKRGEIPGAIAFYRRALEVALNNGDTAPAADDLGRLAELYRMNGEPSLAEKLAGEREKLVGKGKQ